VPFRVENGTVLTRALRASGVSVRARDAGSSCTPGADPGMSADPARSLALHRPKVFFSMLGQRAAPDRDAVITALKPDHSPVGEVVAAADADDQVAVRRPEGIAGPVNVALASDLQQAGRRGMGRPRE